MHGQSVFAYQLVVLVAVWTPKFGPRSEMKALENAIVQNSETQTTEGDGTWEWSEAMPHGFERGMGKILTSFGCLVARGLGTKPMCRQCREDRKLAM